MAPETSDWLVDLLAALQETGGARGSSGGRSSAFAVRARQLLVAFCSLAGDVFPKGDHGEKEGSAGSWRAYC